MKLYLAGDSVFDNAPYVNKGESVSEVLKGKFGLENTLIARDGARIQELSSQLKKIPKNDLKESLIFISCGGNNAVPSIRELERSVGFMGEAFYHFRNIKEDFEKLCETYREEVEELLEKGAHVEVFTIYEGDFPDTNGFPAGSTNRAIQAAASIYNDVIYRAFYPLSGHRFKINELRNICNESEDFIKSIEPSAKGAVKIAGAIKSRVNARMGRLTS